MAMERSKEMHQQKNRNAVFFFLFALFWFCFYNYCTLANTFIIVLTCMFWMCSYHTSPSLEYIILRERILKVFPEVKVKLGKRIAQLGELADRADQVHKACTIANMGANTAGIASGIMSLAGLCLAPVTGGLSVGLSAVALGLNIAATATSVTTSIVEQTNMASIEAKARGMKTMGICPEEVAMGVLYDNKFRFSSLFNSFLRYKQVHGHIHATNLVKDTAYLAAKSSPQSGNLVQRAFGSTAKTMSKRVLVMGGITTGLCLLKDAHSLVQERKHLKEGAKTELAERLRLWAQELDGILEEVNQIYGNLLYVLTPPK
ncbi:apolipoprotein L3-like isoform X4 [Suncus etruscus]|uniref:apolipoprotein L3-like isoform X4 n=1 Tax=Suncus etruscus TaxID=109475 RepID=UPI00210F93BE|nr:apolipoprotein L3-like isoform X4 [Suncus etruscus]